MPLLHALKTWLLHISNKFECSSRGIITLLAVFLGIIFTVIGLSILRISQIHMQLAANKKNSELLDHAAENGLKSGFIKLLELIEAVPAPITLTDQNYALLVSDLQNQGIEAVNTLFAQNTPHLLKGSTPKQSWQSNIRISPFAWASFEQYFTAKYQMEIQTTAGIQISNTQRNAALVATLDLRIGRLPLPLFPILVGQNMNTSDAQKFLATNQISFANAEQNSLVPTQVLTGDKLLADDAIELFEKALRIDIFRPQDLAPDRLRQAIGLEPSPDSIPDGVYLIQDNLGLGGVYVQGGLTQLVLAIEADYQVVAFWQREKRWILKYDPIASFTRFVTPTEDQFFDLIPRGIIIIDGEVESLSAGIISEEGEPIPITDEELPCIRHGIDLTIVSSDRITLNSHIIHQGVKWQDGIPYAKDSSSQLHLLATGNNMMGNDSGKGEIVISSEAPKELKLHGSITGMEKGITIEGQNRTIDLLGSLHFPEYESNDNSLRVHLDTRLLRDESLIHNAPHTRNPILIHGGYRATSWTTRI